MSPKCISRFFGGKLDPKTALLQLILKSIEWVRNPRVFRIFKAFTIWRFNRINAVLPCYPLTKDDFCNKTIGIKKLSNDACSKRRHITLNHQITIFFYLFNRRKLAEKRFDHVKST